MNLILRISLRNLLRQKRRNLLLGVGIGFGMMVLVIAHSFTQGLSDVILNRLIVDFFGHVMVVVREKVGNYPSSLIIRDKDELIERITTRLDGVKEVREAVSTTLVKAVGNGVSVFTVLMGVREGDETLLKNLKTVAGSMEGFFTPANETPLILFSQKARELNVTVGDVVKVRMTTIYGQVQSARLHVTAIVESKNPLMDAACLVPLNQLKQLLGYRPYETSVLSIILNRVNTPGITLETADQLHEAFAPEPAVIPGAFEHGEHRFNGILMGLETDQGAIGLFEKHLTPVKGSLKHFSEKPDEILLGKSLAEALHAETGAKIRFSYHTRFEGVSPVYEYIVAAIITGDKGQHDRAAFLNAPGFHALYYPNLPQKEVPPEIPNWEVPGKESEIYKALSPTYRLLERTSDFEELKKKMQELRRAKWDGAVADVVSMQEVADMALKLEATLNIIGLVTVLILFLIILIGVVNTLRMTIRERTREIGTIRAIGMQRREVGLTFIMEVVFLSLFASIGGIVTGFGVMEILSFMTFEPENMFSIFLDEGHLHFIHNWKTILGDLLFIVMITVMTSYFPSRRAANLPVAKALGHYE